MPSDRPEPPERVRRPPVVAETVAASDDRLAADLRGFGPVGILAMVVIVLAGNVFPGGVAVPVGAVLVLMWAKRSRTPWRDIGYARPGSWIASLAIGLAFGVAFKLLMKAIVMPLLGADPVNQAYHHLAGNRAALPAAVWATLVAGFGEETVFRGFMFERLGKLLGSAPWAWGLIVLLTAAGFGLAHAPTQGLAGVQQATLFGLVFGAVFAFTGRLWTLMFAHAAFDLTALAMIYWDVESDVARLFFR